ncbi:MAG: HD domain-containing protein, partial [Fusobacteriaceae bacterium]|nr:HD domain-containing protein [Fusobacteriaceae bacterium]
MNDRKVKVTIGGLLHDIGKIVYRDERSKKNHSYAGKEFIEKNISSLNDKEIIDQIFYHHSDMLSNATLEENSLAYVTYIADNISAGTDRRKNEGDDERGFDVGLELQSVFNILNSNNEKKTYDGKTFEKEDVNYPKDGKGAIDRELYKNIKLKIKNALNGVNISKESINSILEVFEATSTFVPSSTNKEEIADISIFDHSKMTAAIGACILEYLEANNINDYKNELQKNA